MPHPAIFLKKFLEDIQSLLDRPLEDGNVTISFLEKQDHRHHKGTSPLAEFGAQMVSCFVLDYCHLACLGVIRRLMMFWKGKGM